MSAFRCYALDTSEKFAIEKNNFAFASFDPFWNTSTENQWEISEDGCWPKDDLDTELKCVPYKLKVLMED